MNSDGAKVTPLRPPRPCPECGRPSQRATFPFCSERCRSVDLGRWLTGAYAIPATEDEEAEGDDPDRPGTPPQS